MREKVKIGKDDMDLCECRNHDVVVLGGGKKILFASSFNLE